MSTTPLKWAEVREHYWSSATRHFWRYRCIHCGAVFELPKLAAASGPMRDHLTEQHADKLKQGE